MPFIDNYGRLAEMVDFSRSKSTDLEKPEDVHDLCKKCKDASEEWSSVANRIWEETTV